MVNVSLILFKIMERAFMALLKLYAAAANMRLIASPNNPLLEFGIRKVVKKFFK